MNQPALVNNPFGKAVAPASNNAVAVSESERAIQEVQAAMVIAKKFPRDQMAAMERIINACTRETLAAGALYSYPRGGTEITGPSIRLAEALAQEWGNMQFGIRELSAENGVSTVEAFAWDVETNTRQVKVFQVGHTRYARGELKKLKDPRDIYEMVANQGARRLRACILGVIPGDVTEQAVKQCEVTQASNIDITPESIKSMLEAFEKGYGVTQELVEKRLGRRAEALNAPQMLNLRKIYQSLRDGMSKAVDWFDIDSAEELAGPKTSELNQELSKPEASPEDVDETLEIPGQEIEESQNLTYAELMEVVHHATSETIAEAHSACVSWLSIEGNQKYQSEILASYSHKASQLKAQENVDPEVEF